MKQQEQWSQQWRRSWQLWLKPGMGVKRWLFFLALASVMAGAGFLALLAQGWDWLRLEFWRTPWIGVALLLIGAFLGVTAMRQLAARLVAPFRRPDEAVAESVYRYARGRRGPRIVAIGGGTGMPGLLRGLKAYTSNLTAIVTVADDGGSSGRLRRELGLLPPGDFRNNITALARDETLLSQLMQYRFGENVMAQEPSQLQGHAFGNLLLAALAGVTGSFDEALLAMGRVLAMQGEVMPSTLDTVTLEADVATPEGVQHVVGESAIPQAGGRVRQVYLQPTPAKAYPPALQAILQADVIVLGPGSLYTSVLPNLLVPAVAEALRRSRAAKIYVCNIAQQPGETDGFSVADHVQALTAHGVGDVVDVVLANDNLKAPADAGGGHTVYVPLNPPAGVKMITADLVDNQRPWRHDSDRVAKAVLAVGEAQRQGQLKRLQQV